MKRLKLCLAFAMVITGVGEFSGDLRAGVPESICTAISDTSAFSKKMPELYKNFKRMAQMPLTGKTLHDRLQNSSGGIQVCQTSSDDAQSFFHKTVWLEGGAGASAEFHEYFHAGQYINNSWTTLEKPKLTPRDNAVISMLFEATALAYQLIAEQEATNHRIAFAPSRIKHDLVSQESDIKQTFKLAYDKAFKHYLGQSLMEREVLALETAGRETVRYLLQGKNERWKDGYQSQALEIARASPSYVSGEGEDYENLRRKLYSSAGYVSAQINLTPGEFLGGNIDKSIDDLFKKHFRIEGNKILLSSPN